MTGFTSVVAGGTTITARGAVRDAAERVLGRLWIDRVPARLAAEDADLWPASAGRDDGPLCRPARPGPSRALLERLAGLRAETAAAGLTEVAFAGPRTAAAAVGLAVRGFSDGTGAPPASLEGGDPGPVARLAADPARLARTAVVLGGNDPVLGEVRDRLTDRLTAAGLAPGEAAARFVVVAPPGSDAAEDAAERGHRFVPAPAPTAFGALSPYALVPAALAGADVAALLDEAAAVLPALARPENNPGLVLGAILGGAARAGRETVVLDGFRAAPPALADWIGVLLQESTGGRLRPLVQYGGVPVLPGDDVFLLTLDGRPHQDDATVSGPLAAQLVVWEHAAAVAAYLLGGDPLAPARAGPEAAGAERAAPLFTEGAGATMVEIRTADPGLTGASDLSDLFALLAGRASADGPLSVAAFLDADPVRGEGAQVRRLAAVLAARAARPVTVAWGCRCPAIGNDLREKGVYLVLSGDVWSGGARRTGGGGDRGGPVGARRFARAAGAARAAHAAGRPVAWLHLRDRRAGLARLLDSARSGE
ncbi:hypothetical protein [Actinomadura parmotrematis]|uniref:Glucose-6-phosphate isomerase n=1 Tax=Actinomadura parmotrematis TaxID=2864039 RepID=A0ABS7FSU3_9ACTN|nr:hypothetical protein [Actinomadura parmotrematis]MBW8483265.1 hypothetical protein [Actinomadura parmotrematis]